MDKSPYMESGYYSPEDDEKPCPKTPTPHKFRAREDDLGHSPMMVNVFNKSSNATINGIKSRFD